MPAKRSKKDRTGTTKDSESCRKLKNTCLEGLVATGDSIMIGSERGRCRRAQ